MANMEGPPRPSNNESNDAPKSRKLKMGFGAILEQRNQDQSNTEAEEVKDSAEPNTSPEQLSSPAEDPKSEEVAPGVGSDYASVDATPKVVAPPEADTLPEPTSLPENKAEPVEPVPEPDRVERPANIERPQPVPKWSAFSERQPRTDAEKNVLDARKNMLTDFFNHLGDGSLTRWINAGVDGSSDPRLKERLRELRNQDPDLLEMYELGGESLQDLLDNSRGSDFKDLKFISRALLANNKEKNSQTYWQGLSEDEKQMTRVGELIGLEAERRELEARLASGGPKVDKGMIQRACDRYMKYSQSPDIPDSFRERFTATAEKWATANNIELVKEKKQTPEEAAAKQAAKREVKIAERKEKVGTMIEAYKNPILGQGIEQLQARKQKLVEDSAAARAVEQYLDEGSIEYSDVFLQALKDNVPVYEQPQERKYRNNFVDNLKTQMHRAQFVNSRPSLFWRFGGIAQQWEANVQVVGFWNATFRPSWSADKMREVREDMVNSLQAVAGEGHNADVSAYHAAELALANVYERQEKGNYQGFLADENSGSSERRINDGNASQYVQMSGEEIYDALGGKVDTPVQSETPPRLTIDETSEGFKAADAAINALYESDGQEKKEVVKEAFFDKLVLWREANPTITLKKFQILHTELWQQLKVVAKESDLKPGEYWAEVDKEVAERKSNGLSAAA